MKQERVLSAYKVSTKVCTSPRSSLLKKNQTKENNIKINQGRVTSLAHYTFRKMCFSIVWSLNKVFHEVTKLPLQMKLNKGKYLVMQTALDLFCSTRMWSLNHFPPWYVRVMDIIKVSALTMTPILSAANFNTTK